MHWNLISDKIDKNIYDYCIYYKQPLFVYFSKPFIHSLFFTFMFELLHYDAALTIINKCFITVKR